MQKIGTQKEERMLPPLQSERKRTKQICAQGVQSMHYQKVQQKGSKTDSTITYE